MRYKDGSPTLSLTLSHTRGHTHTHTHTHTYTRTYTHIHKHIDRETDRQTDRHMGTHVSHFLHLLRSAGIKVHDTFSQFSTPQCEMWILFFTLIYFNTLNFVLNMIMT